MGYSKLHGYWIHVFSMLEFDVFPDISRWEFKNLFNYGFLIKGCFGLKSSEVIEKCSLKIFGNYMDI